jgi:hypothetical protein
MILVARLLPILLIAAPAQALAQTCSQEKAIYVGSDGYGLSFQAVGSSAAAVSHRFDLTNGTSRFTGYLMDSEEPVRTIAHVEKDCPEGDVTGEDIAACTAYEGYVYALAAGGTVSNVPLAGDPAAQHLLFTGLGPALSASPLSAKYKLSPLAADLFEFKECLP